MNETTRQLIVHKVKHNTKRLITSIKWVIFSIVVGIVAGGCGTAFYFALSVVTDFRMKYPWLIYFLPIGGLAIVGLYHLCKDDNDTGTNLVISAIHSGDKVPFKMAPLIFVSTLITHLFGGSAGREGAALQMGGSIGSSIGRVFRFDEKDKHVMIMCGMSAAFSASVWHSDGSRYFLHGDDKRRCHVLYSTRSMCDKLPHRSRYRIILQCYK